MFKANAAALIIAHNHPTGNFKSSRADIMSTTRLRKAPNTIDVRMLDHLVVGGSEIVSFADRGIL